MVYAANTGPYICGVGQNGLCTTSLNHHDIIDGRKCHARMQRALHLRLPQAQKRVTCVHKNFSVNRDENCKIVGHDHGLGATFDKRSVSLRASKKNGAARLL